MNVGATMQSERKDAAASAARIQPKDVGTSDTGKVWLGGQSPSLPIRAAAAVADNGKVRLGGQTPSL
jgi:hypothetical protein